MLLFLANSALEFENIDCFDKHARNLAPVFMQITFMHLADTFIQRNLHRIQATHLFVHAFPGNRTHDLGDALPFCVIKKEIIA